MPVITHAVVKAANHTISPKTGQPIPDYIYDNQLKGLILIAYPSGKKTYSIEWARGKKRKIGDATVISPSEARKIGKEYLAVATMGGDPREIGRKPRVLTLEKVVDQEWLPWARRTQKSAEPTAKNMKFSFARFWKKPISEITKHKIERWRQDRLEQGRHTRTVNRQFSDLKRILNWAVDAELIPENPIAKMKKLRVEEEPPVRFLTPDEEDRLRAALDQREEEKRAARDRFNDHQRLRGYAELPSLRHNGFADHIKPIVLLSLNTGCRRGEIFNLTWDDIDFEKSVLTVQGDTAKNGKTRYIPLNCEAYAILETWRAQIGQSQYVFPSIDGRKFDNVKKAMKKLLKMANLENHRPHHDLRHTFGSRLVQNDQNLVVVKDLMGHSRFETTLRYPPRSHPNALCRTRQ